MLFTCKSFSDLVENELKIKQAMRPRSQEELMGLPLAEMLGPALAIVWPGWIVWPGAGHRGTAQPGRGSTALTRCCVQPVFCFPSHGTLSTAEILVSLCTGHTRCPAT